MYKYSGRERGDPGIVLHTELEFLKSLWGLGTEEEEGYRTGPPGYIGWRNSFPGIDSGAPYTFKNTGSEPSLNSLLEKNLLMTTSRFRCPALRPPCRLAADTSPSPPPLPFRCRDPKIRKLPAPTHPSHPFCCRALSYPISSPPTPLPPSANLDLYHHRSEFTILNTGCGTTTFFFA